MEGKLSMGARTGFWVAVLVLLVGACGKATSSSGSNSNWLEVCDTSADCNDGAVCWCNVCATPCNNGQACDQPGTSCQASTGRGCGESPGSSSICVAACETSADCRPFGAAFTCVNAACIAAQSPPVAGGASGTGGSPALQPGNVGALLVGPSQRCLSSNGFLYCWGQNSHGQTGPDPLRGSPDPHLLLEVSNAVELAASTYHTCALTSGGDVYCWGYNGSGEIGADSAAKGTCPDNVLDKPGDYPCQPTPTRVATVSGARHIAVADGRSCAVLADDSVTCWGDVADISTWVAGAVAPEGLALGPSGACAITPQGTLSCSTEVAETRGLHDLKAVVLSGASVSPGEERFGCALGTAGDVHCWGDDSYGQLGAPHAQGTLTNPINDVSQIAATGLGVCALLSDGSVWCWGRNSDGEAGLAPLASPGCGSETCEATPQRVQNLPKVIQLAAGGAVACAVVEDAAVWCWGAEHARAGGAPERVPGPLEGGDLACISGARQADVPLDGSLLGRTLHACEIDQDCTRLSLDLPCLHSCATVPVAKADSAELAAAYADMGQSLCGSTANCAPHEVSCAPSSDVDVCFQGVCTRTNLERSGCIDACSCMAERSAANAVYRGDCVGPNLWVIVAIDCPSCGAGGAWFVIGNRGDTKFVGPATLSFEAEDPDQAALVPEPQSLELTLAPGEVTKAIYVESRGLVTTRSRITGAGDCQPLDDNSNGVTFPAAHACP